MMKKLMVAVGIAVVFGGTFSFAHAEGEQVFATNISVNDSSKKEEIKKLQNLLIRLQLLEIKETAKGSYGSKTRTAVKKFQKAYELPQTGTFGPRTRAKVNELLASGGEVLGVSISLTDLLGIKTANAQTTQTPINYTFSSTLASGDQGTEVIKLQQLLMQYGYLDSGTPSGVMDILTVEMLRQLQEDYKIAPSGITDGLTRNVLNAIAKTLGPCGVPGEKIIVKRANGSEVYQAGLNAKFNWVTCEIPSTETMQMSLVTSAGLSYDLGTVVNDRTEVLPLPAIASWPQMPSGNSFKLKIAHGTVNDLSNGYFTITPNPVTPTYPLSRNTTYLNQSVALPTNNTKIGSWNITGSQTADILLQTLSVDVDEVISTEFDEGDITNMYAVIKNSIGVIMYQTPPLALVNAQDNIFSINYLLQASQARVIELYANLADDGLDLPAGTPDMIDAADAFGTDLTVTGVSTTNSLNTPITATSTDTIGQSIALNQGPSQLIIEKDVSSPSGSVGNFFSDKKLGVYKISAIGEPMKIETLRVAYAGGVNIDDDDDSLRNARILINGVQYGSTASLNEETDSVMPYSQFTLNYTVNPGAPILLEVRADIYDNGGSSDIVPGTDTITAVIVPSSLNVVRINTLGRINAPIASVYANTLAISSTSMSIEKNTTYQDQSTSLPVANFKIGSWKLTGSMVEDILLTTASFDISSAVGTTFNHDDVTNMSMVVRNTSGTIVSQTMPLAVVMANDNNFSLNYTLPVNQVVTIELYGNLNSTSSIGDSLTTDLTISGTSLMSGQSIIAVLPDTYGQTISNSSSSISAILNASTPTTGIVYDNQTVESAKFTFASSGAGFNVTNLTFTLPSTAATVVSSVNLYDGVTLIASQPGGASSILFSGLNWNVPANSNKVLTVKLQLGTIGVGAGVSQADLKTTLTSFTAINTTNGISALGDETNPSGNSIYAYSAVPFISQLPMVSTALLNVSNKPLMKFKIDAMGGPIVWQTLFWDVNKDANTKIASSGFSNSSGITLWDVTNGGNTQVYGQVTHSGLHLAGSTTGTIKFITGEQQISSSKTYELRGTISGADTVGDFVTVTIANDSLSVVPINTLNGIMNADPDAPIVWSDMSAASHTSVTTDWTSDFGVRNLPISGSLNW
ncbi:MAG: hypothetical protein RL641_311 [Candidatus Parcubacteria bacterium]|jgi:peptidoglycan hydrolase-like protein with peptidoglycan-binding domain